MTRLGFCVLCVLIGLFYFSEGKPCPEKFRAHKTRCELYYKCIELPTGMHVWVPKHCAQGLIYESNLRRCVLPGEDWECQLDDDDHQQQQAHKIPTTLTTATATKPIATIATDKTLNATKIKNQSVELNGMDIYIVGEGAGASDNDVDDGEPSVLSNNNQEKDDGIEVVDDLEADYEASGDGAAAMVEVDGFLQAENVPTRPTTSTTATPLATATTPMPLPSPPASMEQKEMSPFNDLQPGIDERPTTTTTIKTAQNSPTKIDPKLTEHLQRLSQLIDGLKQTYQSTAPDQDMRPDQLNAFLSHFNIKNKFDNININLEKPLLERNSTAADTELVSQGVGGAHGKLQPETKVMITRNNYPQRYDGEEYTNSHIVVNRPEGSVLFNLPSPYGSQLLQQQQQQQQHYNKNNNGASSLVTTSTMHDNSPKISEETLKTVLELSKQMIANQNMPKIIPNTAATYYTPSILQPVFLPPQSPVNPYFNYYNNNNNDLGDYGFNVSSAGIYNPYNPYYGQRPQKPPSRPSATTSQAANKPPASTTIIHNVIPLHLSASTNSAEKELLDSYGQRLSLYPTLGIANDEASPYGQRYETNKYIASITTVRPIISTAATTGAPAYQAAQVDAVYPPYPPSGSSHMSITTVRPLLEHHPSPATIAEFYTPSPHLSDSNANSVFHAPSIYPTNNDKGSNVPHPLQHRPSASSSYYQTHAPPLFPSISPNKVKIRPNAQKLESLEMLDDGGSADMGYSSNQQLQQQQQQQQQQQYVGDDDSYDDVDDVSVNDVLSSPYKYTPPPYMPRPSASAPSTSLSPSIFNRPLHGGGGGGGNQRPNSIKLQPNDGYGASSATSAQHQHQHQLVNVGGNFISFDVFKNSILPLLGPTQSLANFGNVEVITCAPGIRQANMTDCTRYYVCSKKDGKVLSYSCPPYTAFNEQTRICDARTYAHCHGEALLGAGGGGNGGYGGYGGSGGGGFGGGGGYGTTHKRTQLDVIKALQEAKRRREQALKTQAINSLLSQFESNGGGIGGSSGGFQSNIDISGGGGGGGAGDDDLLNSYVQQAQLLANSGMLLTTTTTTMRPIIAAASTISPSGTTSTKKRKYYCKEGDKIADQTSMQHYFVCYKNAQGMMKGHKMACTKNLVFCAKTSMCTLMSKCST